MNSASPADRPTIVVLGGLNMDLIGVAPRVPSPGETVVGDHFYTAPGGKGGNQSVAAARMGANVRMVGRVGGDVFGPTLLDDLKKDGIDVTGVAVDDDHASGIAMILLDGDRQNYITAIYGANMQCDHNQVRAAEHGLEHAQGLMLQMEIPFEVSYQAALSAKKLGVPVIWDPAPPRLVPRETMEAIDVITPNQSEAEFLTGTPVHDADSARAAASELVEMGAGPAVVKLGEQGAYFVSQKAAGFVPPFSVRQVDTIAASDAFGGAMTVGLAQGMDLEEAVRIGSAAGALAVTQPGAQEAMPTAAEVDALLRTSQGAAR